MENVAWLYRVTKHNNYLKRNNYSVYEIAINCVFIFVYASLLQMFSIVEGVHFILWFYAFDVFYTVISGIVFRACFKLAGDFKKKANLH